jgi:methyl-accepting chemotaxis protein
MGELANAVAETNASADMVLVASSDVGDKTRQLRAQIDRFLNDVAAA